MFCDKEKSVEITIGAAEKRSAREKERARNN
jgi:hypothetical protein